MATYRYTGSDERTYTGNDQPVLHVVPGDVHDFDGDPYDVHWTPLSLDDAARLEAERLAAEEAAQQAALDQGEPESTDPAGDPQTEKE